MVSAKTSLMPSAPVRAARPVDVEPVSVQVSDFVDYLYSACLEEMEEMAPGIDLSHPDGYYIYNGSVQIELESDDYIDSDEDTLYLRFQPDEGPAVMIEFHLADHHDFFY